MIQRAFPFSNNSPSFQTILLTVSMLLFLLLPIQPASAKPPANKDNAKMECLPIDEDMNAYTCLNVPDAVQCINTHPECEDWASKGECKRNPQYMLLECRQACQSCISLHNGITQMAAQHPRHVVNQLVQSQYYLHNLATKDVKHLKSCINKHEMCTEWAVLGECDSNVGFMSSECRLACKTCT